MIWSMNYPMRDKTYYLPFLKNRNRPTAFGRQNRKLLPFWALVQINRQIPHLRLCRSLLKALP
ncbi:hypothetical protein PH5382_02149 [Phaeobacter sp. CECT 5382]|nr:hypothetical protein PH5382_02149 [Phaeobacter sp. CECT 5382]